MGDRPIACLQILPRAENRTLRRRHDLKIDGRQQRIDHGPDALAHGASVMTVTGIPTFARPARKPEGLLQLEKNATNLHVLILFDGGKGGLGYSRNLRLG
jgi:hypothetical protein